MSVGASREPLLPVVLEADHRHGLLRLESQSPVAQVALRQATHARAGFVGEQHRLARLVGYRAGHQRHPLIGREALAQPGDIRRRGLEDMDFHLRVAAPQFGRVVADVAADVDGELRRAAEQPEHERVLARDRRRPVALALGTRRPLLDAARQPAHEPHHSRRPGHA